MLDTRKRRGGWTRAPRSCGAGRVLAVLTLQVSSAEASGDGTPGADWQIEWLEQRTKTQQATLITCDICLS